MATKGGLTHELLVRSHHVLVSYNDRHLNKHAQNLAFPIKFIPDFFFYFMNILLSFLHASCSLFHSCRVWKKGTVCWDPSMATDWGNGTEAHAISLPWLLCYLGWILKGICQSVSNESIFELQGPRYRSYLSVIFSDLMGADWLEFGLIYSQFDLALKLWFEMRLDSNILIFQKIQKWLLRPN